MKKGSLALLVSRESSYLIEIKASKFQTRDGVFDLNELSKKKFGDEIKTHLNKKFTIVKPNVKDILEKRVKRSAQVILPKDVAMILACTGITPDSLILDCGTGTGYLAIFLANFVPNGKVVTYEKDKRFYKIAEGNIENSGLKNIELKQKDITKSAGVKNVDLVVLDMQKPEKAIKNAYKFLNVGGYLVVYSPTVEEVIAANKEIRKYNFSEIKTLENIVRYWKTERTTRPETMGLMHTGLITFARKIAK